MHLEEHKSLAPYTTIGLGGPARWFVSCRTQEDVIEALKWAAVNQQRVFLLAGGSNSLIADKGFPGLVIHIHLTGLKWQNSGSVTVSAGEDWDAFVKTAVTQGFAGVECLSGIPGSVGSTPIQNVGAYGQEVKDTITSVQVLSRRTLTPHTFTKDQCDFSYRMSRFKGHDRDQFVITSVTFQLKPDGGPTILYPELAKALEENPAWHGALSSAEKLKLTRETVLQIRARKGMVVNPQEPDSRSLGSFFTNPIVSSQHKDQFLAAAQTLNLSNPPLFPGVDANSWKLSAAWLIEHSGTKKGETLGGAAVSSKHSLALINKDHATTADILQLAARIKERVLKVFHIHLDQEPELIR